MPEIDFLELVRLVRSEAACLGHPMGKNEARRFAGLAERSAEFKRWCAEIDASDAAIGLTDLNPHSDATARRAIQRALRAMFNQVVAA